MKQQSTPPAEPLITSVGLSPLIEIQLKVLIRIRRRGLGRVGSLWGFTFETVHPQLQSPTCREHMGIHICSPVYSISTALHRIAQH